MSNLATHYLLSALKRVAYYKSLGDNTFTQLSEPDFYFKPDEESNSIAIIIQHLANNMLSRWTDFLTTDGEKEWRNRDAEFEEQPLNKKELIEAWEKGWQCFLQSLQSLSENDLLKTIYIRQEPLLVVDAINRQMAHYPYHVGQIVYIGKIIKQNNWQNLSIKKGNSNAFNKMMKIKADNSTIK